MDMKKLLRLLGLAMLFPFKLTWKVLGVIFTIVLSMVFLSVMS